MENNEAIQFGGGIELVNFNTIDRPSLIVVKKIIGMHGKIFSEKKNDFKKLSVSVDKSDSYKINAVLTADKEYAGESSDNNLFVALGNALKKIEESL